MCDERLQSTQKQFLTHLLNFDGAFGQTDSYGIRLQFFKHFGNQTGATDGRDDEGNHPKDSLDPGAGSLAHVLQENVD